MKQIVKWLIGIEQEASVYYRTAAKKFVEDKQFSAFAHRLAEEEDSHCALMKDAAEHLERREQISPLTLDDATKTRIEASFAEYKGRLAGNSFTKEGFCDGLVEMEYSEWNRIFLFVVNALKEIDKKFLTGAAQIQQHLKGIEDFFAGRPEFGEHLGRIRRLPSLWQGRVLVVEDDTLVSEFLRVALADIGAVDVAWNGIDALNKMEDSHYDVIICDVVMPKMDGVEFFKTATAKEPETKDRFLFLTGFITDERVSFLKENNLAYILKPAPIGKIKQTVRDIMFKSPRTPKSDAS